MGKRGKSKKEKYFETPVYPSEFHTRTFPNRIYIWIIERFVSIACILMLLAAMQSIYILSKINSIKKSEIYFVYWDEVENKFKKKEYIDEDHNNTVKIPIYQLRAQETFEKYISKRYEIYNDEIINENNWCGCIEDLGVEKSPKLFSDKCYVCKHSSEQEWKNFENLLLQNNIENARNGKSRKVVLLETKIIDSFDGYLRKKESLINKIANLLLAFVGQKSSKETFLAQYIMEAKFAVIQYDENEKKEWIEILSGIAQITSKSKDYEDRIYGFSIDEFDANFISQKEFYINKHLKELKKYE